MLNRASVSKRYRLLHGVKESCGLAQVAIAYGSTGVAMAGDADSHTDKIFQDLGVTFN